MTDFADPESPEEQWILWKTALRMFGPSDEVCAWSAQIVDAEEATAK